MALGDRKEAEMKPTPRSARMGAIADALMAARNFADKAQVPEAVPLIGGQGLGSLVLGKAPEELNEMSYGNMPMRINPLAGRTASYVPEMKRGRKEQVADLAMLAGVPRVGKAGVGLAGVGDVGVGAEKALITYHGTPHRFAPEPDAPLGAFKAEKIGSGEGQQVYGHGLYFAESPNVAKRYQKVLSLNKGEFDLIDKKTETLIPEDTPGFSIVKDRLKSYGADLRDSDIVRFKELWQDTRKRYNEKLGEIKELNKKYAGDTQTLAIIADTKKDYINKIKELEDASTLIDKVKRQPAGSFYTVDIPDEKIEKMLDWDAAIGEQPEAVQKIFNKLAEKDRAKYGEGGGLDYYMSDPDSFSGETIYKYLVEQFGSQKEVSDFLQKEGIPGVKYFDEFSRAAGEGTRNIVVFPGEEKNIKILKRNEEEAPKFAKGGMMKPKINGFQDGGTAVEPTTGNDVPVGALPNEVADDIDAKLSEGEFVIPADVVRYIGLERLMKLRDDAKKGLQRMAQIGQMGNAEEVGAMANSTFEGEDEEDTGQFESDIDEILAEDEGANGQTERMMAAGGLATMPFATGSDLSKAPKNPVFDVRYLKHPDGRTIYVTYYNGKPFTPIPEGFKEVTQEEALKSASAADEAKKAAEKKTETTQQQAGASAGDVDSGGPTASTSTSASMPGTVLGMTPMTMQTIGKGMATVPTIPTMLLGKGLQALSNTMAQEATNASMGAVSEEAQAQAEAMGVTAPATSGMAASNAAVAAADAAINAGHSNEASIAAANAAATAVNQGATGEQAASIAAGAAAAVDAGADTSGNTSAGTGADVGDSVSGVDTGGGVGVMAKGGLVGKRKPKAKRGKGIVAQK